MIGGVLTLSQSLPVADIEFPRLCHARHLSRCHSDSAGRRWGRKAHIEIPQTIWIPTYIHTGSRWKEPPSARAVPPALIFTRLGPFGSLSSPDDVAFPVFLNTNININIYINIPHSFGSHRSATSLWISPLFVSIHHIWINHNLLAASHTASSA